MGAIIRKMKKKDIRELHHVARESWRDTYAGIIPEEIQQRFIDRAYSDDMLKVRMKRSNILVAEVEGKIAGFANFSFTSEQGVAELVAIYLLPEYQRDGIGTALLERGLEDLPASELRLHVEKDNEKGLTFYKSKGFEVIEEFEEDFDGHTLYTIKMSLKLKDAAYES